MCWRRAACSWTPRKQSVCCLSLFLSPKGEFLCHRECCSAEFVSVGCWCWSILEPSFLRKTAVTPLKCFTKRKSQISCENAFLNFGGQACRVVQFNILSSYIRLLKSWTTWNRPLVQRFGSWVGSVWGGREWGLSLLRLARSFREDTRGISLASSSKFQGAWTRKARHGTRREDLVVQVSDTQCWLSGVQLGNAPAGALGLHKFYIADISQQAPFSLSLSLHVQSLLKFPVQKPLRLAAEKRTGELCLKHCLSMLCILQMTHKNEGISESISYIHSRTLILL